MSLSNCPTDNVDVLGDWVYDYDTKSAPPHNIPREFDHNALADVTNMMGNLSYDASSYPSNSMGAAGPSSKFKSPKFGNQVLTLLRPASQTSGLKQAWLNGEISKAHPELALELVIRTLELI